MLQSQEEYAQRTMLRLTSINEPDLTPRDRARLAAAQTMLESDNPHAQVTVTIADAVTFLASHNVSSTDLEHFEGSAYQCQLFGENSELINHLAKNIQGSPEVRVMADTALETALLADSYNKLGQLAYAEDLIDVAYNWAELIDTCNNPQMQDCAHDILPTSDKLVAAINEARKSPTLENAELMVDFVKTVSSAMQSSVLAAADQDQINAGMWAETSKTLLDTYNETLQELRQHPKPEGSPATQPLEISIENLMKTQLDNIEAILISDDAATCLPVIAHQAKIVCAAAQGTGKGALKAANPVNLAKGVYYTANGAYRALSFTLLQSARAQCYSELFLSNPQMAQKFLDAFNADNKRVADTFSATISHMKESWDKMSGFERTEFIFEALTEAALAPKFQTLYIKGLRKTLNTVAARIEQAQPGTTKQQLTANGKLKNPEQVVAEYDRYIQTSRLKLEKLEKYFDAQVANTKDPLFTKTNLDHLFGIDKTQKVRAGGKIDAKYSGFHHDKGLKLKAKGKVEFITEPKIDPKTGAYKVDKLKIEGVELKDKSFFPSEWTRCKTIDKVFEAGENIIETSKDGITCKEVIGKTKEGMEILLVVRKADKFLVTAYPWLKGI
jgi:hypothetical protein